VHRHLERLGDHLRMWKGNGAPTLPCKIRVNLVPAPRPPELAEETSQKSLSSGESSLSDSEADDR